MWDRHLKGLLPLLFLIGCLASHPAYGQDGEKRERERKIGVREVPEHALRWLQEAHGLPKRLTWYQQMSDGEKIYEAKYNWQGDFYSVEFDAEGHIVNIEILRKWNKIPKKGREGMQAYFDSTYTRHKLQKAQVQYTGESAHLKTVFSDQIDGRLTVRYELVYKGKDTNEHALWESLFDSEGHHMKRSKVILRPVDNINF